MKYEYFISPVPSSLRLAPTHQFPLLLWREEGEEEVEGGAEWPKICIFGWISFRFE